MTVGLLVSTCGVLFCAWGVARSLRTMGFPSAPSPRERLRQSPDTHMGPTTTPSVVRCEAGSRASALVADNLTEANDLDVSVPIAWPPMRSDLRSAHPNLISSDKVGTHGSRDTALLGHKSANSALNILYHRALPFTLKDETLSLGSACASLVRASFFKSPSS